MRRNSLALGLVLSILVMAGAAILAVSFQLKDRAWAQNPVLPSAAVSTQETHALNQLERFPPAFVSTRVNPAVDGIIGGNEYQHHYFEEATNIHLYWSIDEVRGIIYIALKSPMQGCAGISLGPSGRLMKGGDVLSGFLDTDGVLQFRDDYAREETIHTADSELAIEPVEGGSTQTQLYGKDDVLSKSGTFSSQSTIIEFSRALDTGDTAFDKAIEPLFMRIQLAYSNRPAFDCFEGPNVTTKQINFFTGETKTEPQS